MTRHQKGYIYRRGSWWYVRFYDSVVQANGSIERVQVARRVAPVCEQYRSKRAVIPLAEEFLLPLNNGTFTPESTMTLGQFVEQTYLPHAVAQKRPSTYRGYKAMWEDYLNARCRDLRLREFRTCNGEKLLADIARQRRLSRNTLKHIKSLLSGVFKHAKRIGVLNGTNPMQDVSIPKGEEGEETYAYSLEEVTQMLAVLPAPASTVIATAAFTGMRKGELRGLLWENYNGTEIWVTQSVWESIVTEPKTRKSKAPIPVIAPLAKKLDAHRFTLGNPASGYVFPSSTGTSLNFANLANRVVKPALVKAGLKWHGWHSFRRGLATNLNRLGVADKTIQAILRHADLSTTMNSYVKTVSADTVAAMQSFERICTEHAPNQPVIQ
jgi:integrase